MKKLRVTLSVKIAGLVLMVVLFFGSYVVLTAVQFRAASKTIEQAVSRVQNSQKQSDQVLGIVQAANAFDQKTVEMLTGQLSLSHMDKLYLASEDSMLVLEHDELLGRVEALARELGSSNATIASLAGPLAEYRKYFQMVDQKISERDLEKARQISVTAVDTASKAVVEGLRKVLTASTSEVQGALAKSQEASRSALDAAGELQRSTGSLGQTLRYMALSSCPRPSAPWRRTWTKSPRVCLRP